MTTSLPPIPRFIFTIFEPIALLSGYFVPTFSTHYFVSSQIPDSSSAALTPTNQILALQLGNVYGLLGLVAIAVLYTTTEPKVVRNYLIACAIADIGHLAVTYHVMGHESFMDIGEWNATAWGNIGITSGLFGTRIAHLLGLGKQKNG